MPVEPGQLASMLKLAKTKPMFFAFVAKGTEGQLLLDKKKIPPKVVAETKKELGGGIIYKGRCQTEDGVLVFEVAKEPPATLATLLKKTIKKDASLTLNVDVRVNAEVEDGEESETEAVEADIVPVAPPIASPSSDGADVMKRLNSLAGGLKAALAGPDGARVQSLFTSAGTLVKAKDFAQAASVLDELEPLVAGAKGTAPPVGEDAAARFASRLKALAPIVQKAEATGSDLAGQAKAQIGEGNKLYVAKKFVEANACLDKAESLLKQALTGSAPGVSLVKLGKARIEWIDTRSKAIQDIKRLQKALLVEFKDDPDQKAQLVDAIKRLDASVTELNEQMANELDAVLNAQEAQRPALVQKAKATMSRFVKYLETDEIMVELDGNEVLPDMMVTEPLRAKLQEIAAALG